MSRPPSSGSALPAIGGYVAARNLREIGPATIDGRSYLHDRAG
jgi:hypothetical protein